MIPGSSRWCQAVLVLVDALMLMHNTTHAMQLQTIAIQDNGGMPKIKMKILSFSKSFDNDI